MILSSLGLGLLLLVSSKQSTAAAVTTCGIRDAETANFRSSAGFTAVLKMHGDDDHRKNTHLCEAEYSLQITTPEKGLRQPFSWTISDGDWDRPIALQVEGFSRDGRHVFLLISDDKYPGEVEAWNYDMLTDSLSSDVSLDSHFTRRLSRACATTLHIVGISPAGLMVLGTRMKDSCDRTRLWQLSPNRITGPTGGAILSEYPKRLSSRSQIEALDPGSIVQR
jgi:hypothetical protein